MAKILFTAIVADVRGKIAGTVFSKNRYGAYARTKVTPSNPKTLAQVQRRSLLAQFAQAWRGLTDIQRSSWNGAVDQYIGTNVFGNSKRMTGSALFSKLNLNIATASGAQISVPPIPTGVAPLTSLSLVANATLNEFEVSFTATPVPVGLVLVLDSTTCLSPGIANANSFFRTIGVLPAASASGADLTLLYTAKFGSLVQGQRVFIRAKLISIATGEVSQELKASAIVGA